MKEVIATKPGYLGSLREPGDRFMVENDLKATWFKPAGKDKPAAKEPDSEPAGKDKPAGQDKPAA